jgi:ubiquinone/menaquinone biosynthesis C-methylase UbiE
MPSPRYLARFFGNLYWLLIQGRGTLKKSFEDVYANEDNGPTFREIYRSVFGDEYAEEADPCGFTTKSDLERIKKLVDLQPGDALADIACGRGGNGLLIARDLGLNLTGLDLSDSAIRIANRRIPDFNMQGKATFLAGDMRNLPLPDTAFDAAVCVDTLYMVPDKQAALHEIRRILRPGRPFVVLTWEMNIPLAVKDYRPLLEECGFQVTSYEEVPGWYERQKGIFENILANQAALIQEMGKRTAAFWINGANTELPKINKMRRVMFSANKK